METKKQKYELMRKMATMQKIVTDYGDIELAGNIDLQVDIGQAIDRYYKRITRENKQLKIPLEQPEKPPEKTVAKTKNTK